MRTWEGFTGRARGGGEASSGSLAGSTVAAGGSRLGLTRGRGPFTWGARGRACWGSRAEGPTNVLPGGLGPGSGDDWAPTEPAQRTGTTVRAANK